MAYIDLNIRAEWLCEYGVAKCVSCQDNIYGQYYRLHVLSDYEKPSEKTATKKTVCASCYELIKPESA